MEIKGIDISYCNPVIDFDKVRKSGVDFVIIRTGYRTKTDTMFKSHIENAIKAGLDVGVYCYCMAKTTAQARTEAKYVLNLIKPYKLTYPVFYDMEDMSIAELSRTKLTNIALAFLNTVNAAGVRCGLYANPSWIENKLFKSKLTGYDIWLAHWTNNPNKPSKYNYGQTMWQWGASDVNGIKGKVDADICFVDYKKDMPKESLATAYALNLRAAPSLSADKLCVIPKGATVTRLDSSVKAIDGYDWYHIEYKNVSGYSAAQYLK